MTESEVAQPSVGADDRATGAAASAPSGSRKAILSVTDLKKYFPVKSSGLVRRTVGNVQAVDGVSFEVVEGSALGLVGESGCGKSTTGRLITRLYEPTAGSMMFEGKDLATLSNRAMTPMRKEVQMIFQDPYSSLNPRHTVGTIVGTPLRVHNVVPEKQVHDLRLDGHVERGHRLVGHEQLGLEGERARDADALALAAREVVRVAVQGARARARASLRAAR